MKRCVELSTGREFAAKFIATPRPQDRKDVEHEVDMMRRLHHRRLVQLYDAFESKKEMCLVLEMYDLLRLRVTNCAELLYVSESIAIEVIKWLG